MAERRYRILHVSPEIIIGLCSGMYQVVGNEMPAGTRIVSRSYNARMDCFELLLQHESFEPVDVKDHVPFAESPRIERIEIEDKLRKLSAVAKAGYELFDGEYSELSSQIVIPLTKHQKSKLRKLADALHDAGYEWMELT